MNTETRRDDLRRRREEACILPSSTVDKLTGASQTNEAGLVFEAGSGASILAFSTGRLKQRVPKPPKGTIKIHQNVYTYENIKAAIKAKYADNPQEIVRDGILVGAGHLASRGLLTHDGTLPDDKLISLREGALEPFTYISEDGEFLNVKFSITERSSAEMGTGTFKILLSDVEKVLLVDMMHAIGIYEHQRLIRHLILVACAHYYLTIEKAATSMDSVDYIAHCKRYINTRLEGS